MGNYARQLELEIDLGPDRGPRPESAPVDTPALTAWAAAGQRRRPSGRDPGPAWVRFAFYGRVSTAEYQDASSSCGWQRDSAHEVIAGRGRIVTEYFDVGYSRTVPWTERPEAARLLAATVDPGRGFDAIIVGEAERAFTGTQLLRLAPVLLTQGVQVWLPEVDGPVDLSDPSHRALIMQLGERSRREVSRARYRTTAAMRAQARDQGRYLGGRPPYGYRLVDAGPHPNAAHAAWGRRLQRLDPDPATAPHVQWIFAERLAGRSLAGIARELNERGVPCPSAADPGRNRHRHGRRWSLQAVRAIVANPRYTGRQVWNRQHIEHRRGDDGGRIRVQQWNPTDQWIVSDRLAHPPLVSEAQYVAVQAIRSTRPSSDGEFRTYRLAGLLHCGICGRRLDSHWVNDRPGYRCRHGYTSASPSTDRPRRHRVIYVREDELLQDLASTLRHESGNPVRPDEVPTRLREGSIVVIFSHTARQLSSVGPTPDRPPSPMGLIVCPRPESVSGAYL
jgi:DNA invertase Pin-like site-specific DNA recombinase